MNSESRLSLRGVVVLLSNCFCRQEALSCLLTELQLVFHCVMHVACGLPFPYPSANREQSQEYRLGSMDCTPKDMQVWFTLVTHHTAFNLVGHSTCAAATFATSIKTHARNMLPLFTQMFQENLSSDFALNS